VSARQCKRKVQFHARELMALAAARIQLLCCQVWADDFLGIAPSQAIAEGLLNLGELFRECMQVRTLNPKP